MGSRAAPPHPRIYRVPPRAETFLEGVMSLGLCYGIAQNPDKKWIDLQNKQLSFLERKLMFNNMCKVFSVR